MAYILGRNRKHPVLSITSLVIILAAIQCLALLLVVWSWYTTGQVDPFRCHSLLGPGRWSYHNNHDNTWNPHHCVLHNYTTTSIHQCTANGTLHFRGDSTVRQLFWAVAEKVDVVSARTLSAATSKHADVHFRAKGTSLRFLWDPFLNQSSHGDWPVIVGGGLWHARYLNDSVGSYAYAIEEHLDKWHMKATSDALQSPVIFLPVTIPIFERLDANRAATIDVETVVEMNRKLQQIEASKNVSVAWSSLHMMNGRPGLFIEDGLHLSSWGAAAEANVLLNRICNPILSQQGSTLQTNCCVVIRYHWTQLSIISILIAVVLARITCWIVESRHSTAAGPQAKGVQGRGRKLYHLLSAACALSLAVLYCFAADRTFLLGKTTKIVNVGMFVVTVGLSLLAGLSAVQRVVSNDLSPADNILSRNQTDEWKGWMQAVILLYHYFGMSCILWIYRIVRVLVSAYLCLTGYGHTRYFLKTRDFSLRRLAGVLVRLNLLTCVLAYMMDTSWDFYYFPALSSVWFIVVYATFFRLTNKAYSVKEATIRMLVSVSVLTYLTWSESVLEKLLRIAVHYGGLGVNVQEFMFRLCLDLYAPYLGMIIAIAREPIYAGVLEHRYSRKVREVAAAVAMLAIIAYFWSTSYFPTKVAYNEWHPIISGIPILGYIALRNFNHRMRSRYSSMFAWLGGCSLETFVLQYHIWLALDTKATLHLGILDRPGISDQAPVLSISSWRYWLEKAFITAIFLWTSHVVAKATGILANGIVGSRR